ncbi:hypothetical protein CBM2633_A10281 [Cupriavidus taiwanensis]|nr:hypothetical protein CBM2633_A10281 [Cupriavidus taiwanensis]
MVGEVGLGLRPLICWTVKTSKHRRSQQHRAIRAPTRTKKSLADRANCFQYRRRECSSKELGIWHINRFDVRDEVLRQLDCTLRLNLAELCACNRNCDR